MTAITTIEIGIDTEVVTLAREIKREEGCSIREALELAALEMKALAVYARDWDKTAEAARTAT
jgi:hypothetical protein